MEPGPLRPKVHAIFWQRDAASDTPIFDRNQLGQVFRIEGPAMIEGDDTTMPSQEIGRLRSMRPDALYFRHGQT